jgi:hypothetical protein
MYICKVLLGPTCWVLWELWRLIFTVFGMQWALPRFVPGLLVDWHGDLERKILSWGEGNASVFNLDHLD